MDATEATIKTSLQNNQRQFTAILKTLHKMKTPKRSDKAKMMRFANAQASMVASQGRLSEDLHLLRTLGFMSTDEVVKFSKHLTQQMKSVSKSGQK